MRCCWRCADDPDVAGLAIAPGNAGTSAIADQYEVDISSGDAVTGIGPEDRR